MRFWLPALVAIAVLPVGAHHPFTPYYDASKPASISGPIVELRTVNPHAVLIIEGTGPDGRTGRWARRAKLGPWDVRTSAAGLDASVIPCVSSRRASRGRTRSARCSSARRR